MKATKLLTQVCCLLSFSLLTEFSTADNNKKECHLVAGFDNANPFHYKDESQQIIGIDADILRFLTRSVGCSLEFVELPWSRTLAYVEQGEIDIAIGAGYKVERTQWGHYSPPYKFINHWLYTKQDRYQDIDSLESFLAAKLKIGTVLGWGYPPEVRFLLDNPVYKQQVKQTSVFASLPKMLSSNRVDGIMAIPAHLKEEHSDNIQSGPFSVRAKYREALHFLFSKKSVPPMIVAEFNNAVVRFNNSRKRKEIFDRY